MIIMENQLVDFSFVYDMAEGDTTYIYELLSLFLKTLSEGMVKLEGIIKSDEDYEAIRFQAHFLKSSAKVVKVKGMFEGFVELEALAREHMSRERMLVILADLLIIFENARPVLEAEVLKNQI